MLVGKGHSTVRTFRSRSEILLNATDTDMASQEAFKSTTRFNLAWKVIVKHKTWI
jgi:hypothetical protein